jgi:hypothetical protein
MGKYAAEHAGALADVAEAGVSVTFSRVVDGTHDPETGLFTGSTTTTVAGSAIKVKGSPEAYQALNLVPSAAPSLFFVPSTEGEYPKPGDTVTWASEVYTVRDTEHIAPDGIVIATKTVIAR